MAVCTSSHTVVDLLPPRPMSSVDKGPSPEAAEAPGLVWAFVFPVIKIIRPFKRWQSIYSTPILKITQRSLNKHFLRTEKVQNEDKEGGEKDKFPALKKSAILGNTSQTGNPVLEPEVQTISKKQAGKERDIFSEKVMFIHWALRDRKKCF